MTKFQAFEASLLGMLVDKCNADRECLAKLVGLENLHGRMLVERVLEMKLVDEKRLARLISQYWELPLVDVSFPYRRFLVHFSRPIQDLLEHELLPVEFRDDELTVVSYYVPNEDVVRAVEEARGMRLRPYISALSPVKEALLRLREEVRRFRATEPVDCGTDKELFYKAASEGRPAVLRERFQGGVILIEFSRDRRLTKTVESLDPSEPSPMQEFLLGKSMSATVPVGGDLRRFVGDFRDSVSLFEGELAEAILKLRVAQMMFESEENP